VSVGVIRDKAENEPARGGEGEGEGDRGRVRKRERGS